MTPHHLVAINNEGWLHIYGFIDPFQVQLSHTLALPEAFLETYPSDTLKVIYDESEDTLVIWSHETLSPRSNRGDRSHYFYSSKAQSPFEKKYLDPTFNYSFLYSNNENDSEVLMLMVNRIDPGDLSLIPLDKIDIRMDNYRQRIIDKNEA